MKRYFIFAALGLFFALAVLGRSMAISDTNFSIDSTYKIVANGTGTVSHVINGKNATAQKTPAVLKIPFAGSEASSIAAKVNNKTVSATIGEGSSTIDVKLPDLTGKDKTWKLTLSYKSQMVSELGKAKLVQVPTMNGIGLTISSQKAVVSAGLDVGLAVALPAPDKTDIATGEQIFTYQNPSGALKNTITLTFGDETPAVVSVSTELKNNGWWWKTVELTLPPDTNQQQVILESLEPQPSNVRLDQDGNILAQYRLGPKKSINVTAKTIVNVRNLSYDLDSKKKVNEIDPGLAELYTAQTDKWSGEQIDVDINPVASAAEITVTIYDAVVDKARAESTVDNNEQYDGPAINSEGEYADVLIGELRANGIPARAVLGKLATDGQFVSGNSQNHVWAESYLPDIGWVTMDPDLAVYGDYYGKSEVMHVGLALWGVSDHLPPVDLNIMNVEYSADDFVVPTDTPVLSAVKTVIFPGISIMSVNVTMPAGAITDGNAVEFGSQTHLLGSLAPLQTAGAKDFRYGAAAFNSEEVKYGYSDGEAIVTEISTAQSTTSYVALIVEAIVIIIGVILFFVIRKRRSAVKYRPSKDSLMMHDEDAGGSVEDIDMVGKKPIHDSPPEASPKPPATIKPSVPASKPQATRGTINTSSNGSNFQKTNVANPRRHIIQ